jgi:hypothetical protein
MCRGGLLRLAAKTAQSPSQAEQEEEDSDGTYGSPRVTRQLACNGQPVNHKRVERVTRENNWSGIGPAGDAA